MSNRSKRYRECREKVDRTKRYTVEEAIQVLKGLPHTKFNESLEVALKLGVDPKQADQIVRGSISLPKGTGRETSVVVFATGEQAEKALAAGAVAAGGEELVKRIQDGWTDFDVAIATPDMMRQVGRLGRILGPQGKMPSPKSGTVTENAAEATAEYRAGRVEYRTDQGGNIHVPVGKLDFPDEDLKQNIEALIDHINAARPAAAKGTFIESAHVCSSMSPGLTLAV